MDKKNVPLDRVSKYPEYSAHWSVSYPAFSRSSSSSCAHKSEESADVNGCCLSDPHPPSVGPTRDLSVPSSSALEGNSNEMIDAKSGEFPLLRPAPAPYAVPGANLDGCCDCLPEDRLNWALENLRLQVTEKDALITKLQAREKYLEQSLQEMQETINKQKECIENLNRDADKFRSVLHQLGVQSEVPSISQLCSSETTVKRRLLKKQGVSGESTLVTTEEVHNLPYIHYPKDEASKACIKEAFMNNDLLRHLSYAQLEEISDAMYASEIQSGSYVIQENEPGNELYVCAKGVLEVQRNSSILGNLYAGMVFGELAVLYNCNRTASVKAVTDAKLWVLNRKVFQNVMMTTNLKELEGNIHFLRSVPLFSELSPQRLSEIATVLEAESFPPETFIVRQGYPGDTFYIIRSGEVRILQRQESGEQQLLRVLGAGDYFGEKALLTTDRRTASAVTSTEVECLTLDRQCFMRLVGQLEEFHACGRYESKVSRGYAYDVEDPILTSSIRLQDLKVVSTLGVGGFGRVELVQLVANPEVTFALKILKKKHILDTQQMQHLYNEKEIMMESRCPFIVRMYKTFRDAKCVYMLMEACLGGELWSILRDRGFFHETFARFYAACVIEALGYLHERNIIYRDLKPENLLLDSRGYVKMVDFGFSKKLGDCTKTWTFCGTPEYVAPETILNRGHDRAVDYWSLGILVFELSTGAPPFTSDDPMKTYRLILGGIDRVTFPRHISRAAYLFISKCCSHVSTERLGYGTNGISDFRKHR